LRPAPPKLLERVREAIRARHYSRRTEEAYVCWIRRFILFHNKAHPSTIAAAEISAFLTWLAVHEQVSASTQNQALSAILFLYRIVLQVDPGRVEKDIDFDRREVVVRRGKGQRDRRTMLPDRVKEPLTQHLAHVQRLHHRDLAAGLGRVVMPDALSRKYPNAAAEWRWQFVFPAGRICRDPRFGPRRGITCTSPSCSEPSRRLRVGQA